MKKFTLISTVCAVVAFLVGLSWTRLSPLMPNFLFSKTTLKVLCDETWLPEELLQNYAKANGLKIDYYTYAKPSELVRQIANAGSEFDLLCFHSSLTKSLIEAGVLRKIEPRELSNFEQISVDFHNLPFDPGFAYSIPIFWNVYGFLTKNVIAKDLEWKDVWRNSASKMAFWPSELDIFFTMMKSGLEVTEWTDENQTKRFSEYLKRFSASTYGWVNLQEVAVSARDLGPHLELVQVPSGRAAKFLAENKDLKYWIPSDGASVGVALLGIGANSKHSAEAFQLVDWLIDGAQALRIQRFALGAVVQPALNNSDQLEEMQKASWIRSIPTSGLSFTDIDLDTIPRFEKLFREISIESKRH